jgi:hypothetical protein
MQMRIELKFRLIRERMLVAEALDNRDSWKDARRFVKGACGWNFEQASNNRVMKPSRLITCSDSSWLLWWSRSCVQLSFSVLCPACCDMLSD